MSFTTDVDVFPAASKDEEASLAQRRELVVARQALAVEAEGLRTSMAAAEGDYRGRKEQLKRLDSSLAELKSQVDGSLVRLDRVRLVRGGVGRGEGGEGQLFGASTQEGVSSVSKSTGT